MKRNIIISILFVMSVIFNVEASNTQFICEPSILTVNDAGGKFKVYIRQSPQTTDETCYLYNIDNKLNIEDNSGYMVNCDVLMYNQLVIEFKPRDTADRISGTILVGCYLKRTDNLDFKPIFGLNSDDSNADTNAIIPDLGDSDYYEYVYRTFEIEYRYSAVAGLFGGVIEEDDTWYELGASPKRINSVSPAVCGQIGEIVYVWEKKVGNGSWTETENSNYDFYNPEVMGYQSVLYRRKATCGNYTEYSNTVEKRAVLNAGEIGMEYMDTSLTINLTDKRSPSVAVSQLFWESSEDMDSWTKISSGRLTMQVYKPAVTTYYRRAASSLDGETVRYSNVVCYNCANPVYISKKVSTDRLGRTGIEDIMYYDGLGRPMQSVGVNAAASNADVITAFTYDNKGRQAYDHLPISITGNGGSFVKNIEYKADMYYKSLYNNSTSVYPYVKNEYDGSPLNRIVKTYRQGAEYQADSDRFVSYSYALNDADEVRKLSVSNNNILSVGGFYPKNELYKNTVVDEDGNSKVTFTDAYGNMVLSRQWTQANGNIDTYYVYDKCNRLRWVVSPEGSAQLAKSSLYTIDSDFAKKYCYRYAYGSNGLVSERHIPGQDGPEMLYYDDMNRVDSLTTAASRSQGIYYKYKYDNFGRISRIGAVSRVLLLNQPSDDSHSIGHFEYKSYGTSVYNYDVYDCSDDFADHEFIPVEGIVSDNEKYNNTVGQKTHEKIYEVFDKSRIQNRDYLCRTYYYDVRNRIIQTVETDSRENMLRTSYMYDYVGNVLTRNEQYTVGGVITDIRYDYTYDSRGRVTAENISINGEPQTDVKSTYDGIGRLKSVMFGDKINTQYSYNIQGWLTSKYIRQNIIFSPIRSLGLELGGGTSFDEVGDLFEERLRYFDPINAQPLYSGNIAEMEWKSSSGRSCLYAYAYTYDELGRMTNSDLHIRNGAGIVGYMDGERNIAYDRNGNITHFERGNSISALYTYDRTFYGNRMTNSDEQTEAIVFDGIDFTTVVSDPMSTTFGYDSMGNITSIAGDEDLEIKYNLLNLPKEIQKSGEVESKYTYLSDCSKVSSCDADGNGYMYFGIARFTLENDVPTFESIPFSGGRIVKTTNGYEPQYYLTDHLGSTRMIVNKDGKTVEATFDYTPFGVQITGASLPTNSTEYRFSGKELQNISDYEIYDFGARQYFPKYAIWGSVDPLSETYYPITPYAYCANNPIRYIDPDGMRWKNLKDEDIADQLQSNITRQLDELDRKKRRINDKINNILNNTKIDDNSKKLLIAKQNKKLAEISVEKDNLSDLQSGIAEIGASESLFTFQTQSNNDGIGYVGTNADGLTTIFNDGSLGNRIHETTHAVQVVRGQIVVDENGFTQAGTKLGVVAREIPAYQNQFFMTGHAPFSTVGGIPTKITDINKDWLLGIKDVNGNYVYR